jgi:YD repeat-containing protein
MLTTFEYDKANRLQRSTRGSVVTTYTFNAAGNRTS